MPKKKKPIVLSEIKEEEKLKYEIAEELGLLDRVLATAGVPSPPVKPDGSEECCARETKSNET